MSLVAADLTGIISKHDPHERNGAAIPFRMANANPALETVAIALMLQSWQPQLNEFLKRHLSSQMRTACFWRNVWWKA